MLKEKEKINNWLDKSEVAIMLRITTRTVERWSKKGIFHAYKVNGKTYFLREEIDSVIKSNIVQENGRLDPLSALVEGRF